MIWMFITLGLMIGFMLVLIFTMPSFGRQLSSFLGNAVMFALLGVGTAVCLNKGTVNLALTGITGLCACLAALLSEVDGAMVVSTFVALFLGAALGALTGLFTIQSRRNVLLVTGISSLIIGTFFSTIAVLISSYSGIRAKVDRDTTLVFSIIFLILAAAAAVLGGLGRSFSTNRGDRAPRPGGGMRFLWTTIAGALAGLAGILMVARIGGYQPNSYTNLLELDIIPILLLAGVLIANVRHSAGEGIFGGVSVIFASIIFSAITMLMSRASIDAYYQRLLIMILSLLLLIPNILICRGQKRTPQPQGSWAYQQYPPQEPAYPEYPQQEPSYQEYQPQEAAFQEYQPQEPEGYQPPQYPNA